MSEGKPRGTELAPVGSREVQNIEEGLKGDLVTDLDIARAELDMQPMQVVAELFAVASNVAKHSDDEKRKLLEQTIGLIKILEIEQKIQSTLDAEKQTLLRKLMSFVPILRSFLETKEQKEREVRLRVVRNELINGARLLADELGVEFDSREKRLMQLELYIKRLDNLLKDPAIHYGVRLHTTKTPVLKWELVNGYPVKKAYTEQSIILGSPDVNIVQSQIQDILTSLGSDRKPTIDEGSIVDSRDPKRYVKFWDLTDFTRILKDLQLEYTKEKETIENNAS